MMERTDRHYRYMMRLVTRRTLLYTEMINTNAILHSDPARHLDFNAGEEPLALQLGGDDPEAMARCARIAQEWGYDEVNINVGCPSSRVQRGSFGASLMARPETVRACVAAMREACDLPVTVKHRIGIDDLDRYEDMKNFVEVVSQAHSDRFTVHARKAWLKGLSPKENRNVPPLRYEEVYRLKRELPELIIEINGGVLTLAQTLEHLQHVDAVMIGRAAYDNPWMFSRADAEVFGQADTPAPSRRQVIEVMAGYLEGHLASGGRAPHVLRHMLNLFAGQPGTRAWKRHLTQEGHKPGVTPQVLLDALEKVEQTQARKVV
jgi:tRNA-dihydrouridine synthase A